MQIVMAKKEEYYVFKFEELKEIKNIDQYFDINPKVIGKER